MLCVQAGDSGLIGQHSLHFHGKLAASALLSSGGSAGQHSLIYQVMLAMSAMLALSMPPLPSIAISMKCAPGAALQWGYGSAIANPSNFVRIFGSVIIMKI